jgi:uncharacterized protein YsxB (DUF464 family)
MRQEMHDIQVEAHADRPTIVCAAFSRVIFVNAPFIRL